MFPIIDMTGRVTAFGGRILGEGKPKYMNSPESPIFDKGRLLFGLHQHRETIRRQRRALVVEGNFDLLLLAVHGIDNVVAPLGTALTREHVRALRTYSSEAILLFDADAAGLKAAMRSIPFFLAEQVDGRVAVLPAGHDPDSFVRAEGPAAVAALVDNARPLAEFAFDALVREHGLTLAGKSKITTELKALLKEAADPEQRALMTAHFSAKLGVSSGYFMSGVTSPRAPAAPVPVDLPQGLARLQKKEQQFVDFLILYPQYFSELQRAGLLEVFENPAIAQFVRLVEEVSQETTCQSELLLERAADEQVRVYIAQVLTRDMASPDEQEEHAKRMYNELVQGLQADRKKQDAAALQEQINQAERLGNTRLLMELLRRKQKLQQKSEEG
jgi:DNA primase